MTDTARVIRTFVSSSHDQCAWMAAWDLTVGHVTTYLRGWESRGRKLPLSLFAGDKPHRDLAILVIGELFMPGKGGAVYPLVRFLRPHLSESDDELINHFILIIRKTARQNVHKLEHETNAPAFNIRKSVRRALVHSHGEYTDVSMGKRREWVWTKRKSGERLELPRVDDNILHVWVTAACRSETLTPPQCRCVFFALDADDRFRNTLLFYPLVKMFINVRLDHEPLLETIPESPFLVRIRGLVQSVSERALDDTLRDDLPRLSKLAKLNEHEVEGVKAAFKTWLEDWVEHFDNDSLREYLSEQLGDIPLAVYQKRFHYLWNTLTSKCKDRILMYVRSRIGISNE